MIRYSVILFIHVFLLIHCDGISETKSQRNRRHLVYPSGSSFNVITGIGIPMQIDESVASVGLFLDFNYDLPVNESLYNYVLYNQLQTISSRKLHTFNERNKNKWSMVENDLIEDDILSEKGQKKLENINPTSLDNQQSKQSKSIFENEPTFEQEENQLPSKFIKNRWYFYNILEKYAPYYKINGRPCILRSICEAAHLPFTHENGLLGEILHILLTPSTSTDELSHHTDNEYLAAERFGRLSRASENKCRNIFSECKESFMDMFTKIHEL